MDAIASEITSLTSVYSTVYSDADQRKHQRSASLAFVRGIHRWPVNSPHKWSVTRKIFPFDDVIMKWSRLLDVEVVITGWAVGDEIDNSRRFRWISCHKLLLIPCEFDIFGMPLWLIRTLISTTILFRHLYGFFYQTVQIRVAARETFGNIFRT